MREFTEVTDLTGVTEAFPDARKVTVDMDGKAIYVFNGRSNRAVVVTGAEFDKLVTVLPAEVDETPVDEQAEGETEPEAKARTTRGKKER